MKMLEYTDNETAQDTRQREKQTKLSSLLCILCCFTVQHVQYQPAQLQDANYAQIHQCKEYATNSHRHNQKDRKAYCRMPMLITTARETLTGSYKT